MAVQDNEDYQSRVSNAVIQAVLEAGRAHAGAADLNVDVNEAMLGMCSAMATFAATIAQMPGDRKTGAELLETMEAEVVARLRFFADKIRSGEFPPSERPKPRLVK